MPTFAELLLSEQGNPNAALMQILVSEYRRYDIIVAVEGDDDRIFYYDFLQSYMGGRSVFTIGCGGKDALISLKQLVHEYDWGGQQPVLKYLCDKDFDDFLDMQIPDVHYLPVYSIENYFVSVDFVIYILGKFARGNLTAAEATTIIDRYRELMDQMSSEVRLVSALMLRLRELGLHPDFDTVSINDLLDVRGERPRPLRDRWQVLAERWGVPANCSPLTLRNIARDFRTRDTSSWLRGKLAMQMARLALRRAIGTLPEASRHKAPDVNLISSESFRYAMQYLRDLPTLRTYCQAA